MPLVSIIVPVYKVEPFLRDCIDSILKQSFKDFELLLIDDGSPDNCPAICDEYAKKDNRIIVIHKENKGPSSARNIGITRAIGEFVMFVDGDDWIAPDCLNILNNTANEDFIICKIKETYDEPSSFIYYEKKYKPKYYNFTKLDIIYDNYNMFSSCAKVYRRLLLVNNNIFFNEDQHWGEDGRFVALYLSYIDHLCVFDYYGYYYRKKTTNSLTQIFNNKTIDWIIDSRTIICQLLRNKLEKNCYNQLEAFILDDIKSNIAYFIKKLYISKSVSLLCKIKLLDFFRKNVLYKSMVIENEKIEDKRITMSLKLKPAFLSFSIYGLMKVVGRVSRLIKKRFI